VSEPKIAGWYRDPFGRYEKRYHTGTGWTEHVKNKMRAAIDPPHPRISDHGRPRHTPTPARAAIHAAPSARSSVAVAFPPTANRRAASSYLKPAPKMVTAPEARRVRWPWVVGAIVVLVGIAVATGFGMISGAPEEPRAAPSTPLRAPHTISEVAYNFVTVGTSRTRVIAGLGKQPASRAEYRRVFPIATMDNSCAYFYGKAPRVSYSFCFDDKGTLISKTTRSLPVSVRGPGSKTS